MAHRKRAANLARELVHASTERRDHVLRVFQLHAPPQILRTLRGIHDLMIEDYGLPAPVAALFAVVRAVSAFRLSDSSSRRNSSVAIFFF